MDVLATTPCSQSGCPLPAEPVAPVGAESGGATLHRDALCVLHTVRDGKARDELAPAFAALTAAGVIRVQHLHLVGADLGGINLELKNLQHSDLRGACLRNARLNKVGLDFSLLDDVDFESAILEKVDLRRRVGDINAHLPSSIFFL